MDKKVWIGFIAVFVTAEILNFLVNGLLLMPIFLSLQNIWRADIMSKMWIFHLNILLGSLLFAFVFSKGYEAKGIPEGVRYGLYIGVWMSSAMAYGTYVMIAIPYSLALEWFLLGILEYVIMGVVLSLVFQRRAAQTV